MPTRSARPLPASALAAVLLLPGAADARAESARGVLSVRALEAAPRATTRSWHVAAEPWLLERIPHEMLAPGASAADGGVTVTLPAAPGTDPSALLAAVLDHLTRDVGAIPGGGVAPSGTGADPCLDPCRLWSGDGSGRLYSIDPVTATSTLVGDMGTVMFDIAASTNGRLYGMSGNTLYEIDACDASITPLGASAGGNGLAGDAASDDLFAQGPPLSRVPLPATAPVIVGGTFGGGPPAWCGGSSGDLSHSPSDGLLYSSVSCAGCAGDTLIAVDPASGAVVDQVGCFVNAVTMQPLSGVFGLAHDCECRLWAALSSGSAIFLVDPATGLAIPTSVIGGFNGTFGLASVPPVACGANQPPTCSASADAPACWSAALHGVATDPDGDTLVLSWSSSCAGAQFSPSADVADPVVTVPAGCRTCTFTLTVDDGEAPPCSSPVVVTFADATPPSTSCPPDLVVECDGSGNEAERDAWLAQFSATDDCGPVTTTTTSVPGVIAGTIAFADFCDLSSLTLNGSAADIHGCTPAPCEPVVSGGACVLRLTDDLNQGGSAFTTLPITLASDASFSTFFTFQITDPQDCGGMGGADGLVFVVQTVANDVGGLGGGIGYQGIDDSLGIEFDTWNNGAPDAFSSNHVGINLDGDTASVVLAPVVPDFNDGNVWRAWVDYDGATDQLEVRVTQSPARPAVPQVSLVVDLPAVLGQVDAFVGFTSGTGCAGGDHDVRSWVLVNNFAPVNCSGTGTESVTFTAVDACGSSTSCTRTFEIVDTMPPALAGCPADATVACNQPVPPPATVTADDACDGTLVPGFAERTDPGPCADESVVTRTWTATDECGNAASCTQVIQVVDDTPPAFVGCPGPLVLECGQPVPPPAAVAAVDDCDPAPDVDMTETIEPGPCGGTVTRTWTATDRCGNAATCTQVITYVDTTPPAVTAGVAVGCLWPPNHQWVDVGLHAEAVDGCGPASELQVVAITSDEPTATELGAGGPRHCPDALVDGMTVRLRAERSGGSDGRVYAIRVRATDACGNAGEAVVEVRVPHDQDPKTPGQTHGNDPDGECPAIAGPAQFDATACN